MMVECNSEGNLRMIEILLSRGSEASCTAMLDSIPR